MVCFLQLVMLLLILTPDLQSSLLVSFNLYLLVVSPESTAISDSTKVLKFPESLD